MNNKKKTIIRIKLLIQKTRRTLYLLESELQSIIDAEEKHDR
jgi:hypothetical protein